MAYRGHFPPSEPWPIPKIVDYDEQEHRFYYDEKQIYENPDWTYSVPSGCRRSGNTTERAAAL